VTGTRIVTKRQKNKLKKENPKAFKHFINYEVLQRISNSIKKVYPKFNEQEFQKINSKLDPLELKQRVGLVCHQLYLNLPKEYLAANKILIAASKNSLLKGFDLWPFADYVQTYGLQSFDASMEALYLLTQKFTSEFAVRPFIIQDPKKSYAQLLALAEDSNEHIRRWASEGSRPRLPWGIKLQNAVNDPSDGIKILEKLIFDESLYVRKSVANHLNDISKDHPQLSVQLAKKWLKKTPPEHRNKVDWIIVRGLRTLIKKGSPEALSLLGARHNAKFKFSNFSLKSINIDVGSRLEFSFKIKSTSIKNQKLIIDYAIYFLKSNRQYYRKVFKLKTFELSALSEFKIVKVHLLKPITTMKYYPGPQFLEIQVNGNRCVKKKWFLRE
jgi:3-methyladenine DNA glycosylase AlkC